MIGGLVYGYVVFMILPVYASLERMDGSLIEAGRDLYGTPAAHVPHRHRAGHPGRRVRRRARWSSCRRWATSSAPSCSAAPDNLMIGNLIQEQVLRGPELAARRRADRWR